MMSLRSVIFPLLIFDLAFLPMFHLAGLPFKPSYLAIIFLVLFNKRVGTIFARGRRRDFIILFAILGLATLMGSLIYILVYGNSGYEQSLRNILIYLLAPMAFLVGSSDIRTRHGYIVGLLFAYAFLTLTISIFYRQLIWLVDFYNLASDTASGLFAVRSQGLFENANISALFMTIIFMYFIAGIKHGFVHFRPTVIVLAVAAVFMTIIVLQSRNQLMAVYILTLLLLGHLARKRCSRRTVLGLLAGATLVIVISSQLTGLARQYLGYDPVSRLQSGLSRITDVGNSSQSFLRPVQRLDEATSRWLASPLLGTGFDESGNEPFEGTNYHNDWLYVLTASGLVGLAAFAFLVFLLAKIDIIFLVPFLLPGMTNSFIFAPSHLLLFMILAGFVWRRKVMARRQTSEVTVGASDLPALRQLPHTG